LIKIILVLVFITNHLKELEGNYLYTI